MTAITFFSFVYARGGVRFSFPMAFCGRVCSTWEDSVKECKEPVTSWATLVWLAMSTLGCTHPDLPLQGSFEVCLMLTDNFHLYSWFVYSVCQSRRKLGCRLP